MNILLVEPNYKNKYPPMGLMKISTYHKNRGDNVTFYKGLLKSEDFSQGQFDRIYITSLFTFHYKITLKTILYYCRLSRPENIFIGGIMVSLLSDQLRLDLGNQVNFLVGLLTDSVMLGFNDAVNIDSLPLDYGILDEIEYDYPAGDNYISYTTRGCPNRCLFCAVPLLEPQYSITNNIKKTNL